MLCLLATSPIPTSPPASLQVPATLTFTFTLPFEWASLIPSTRSLHWPFPLLDALLPDLTIGSFSSFGSLLKGLLLTEASPSLPSSHALLLSCLPSFTALIPTGILVIIGLLVHCMSPPIERQVQELRASAHPPMVLWVPVLSAGVADGVTLGKAGCRKALTHLWQESKKGVPEQRVNRNSPRVGCLVSPLGSLEETRVPSGVLAFLLQK